MFFPKVLFQLKMFCSQREVTEKKCDCSDGKAEDTGLTERLSVQNPALARQIDKFFLVFVWLLWNLSYLPLGVCRIPANTCTNKCRGKREEGTLSP